MRLDLRPALNEFGDSLDHRMPMTGHWGAPAHQDEIFALLDAFGEGLGGASHGSMAGDVRAVFLLVAGDDFGPLGVVAMVLENEGIAEDRMGPVDVDHRFAGTRFQGRTLSFIAEADGTRSWGFCGHLVCALGSRRR